MSKNNLYNQQYLGSDVIPYLHHVQLPFQKIVSTTSTNTDYMYVTPYII